MPDLLGKVSERLRDGLGAGNATSDANAEFL
jgi:hypothetical protein